MVDDIKSKNTYDHLWGVLTTPGFLEVIGPEKFYKSEMNLSHSFSPEFKKAVRQFIFINYDVMYILDKERT